MDKKLIKGFEKHFDSERLKRGKAYYQQGLVKNVKIQDNLIKAIVEGNSNYRVKIELDKNKLACTCPDSENCKHLAAVFYYLSSNKFQDIEKIINKFEKGGKKELIKILKRLLTYDQNLTRLLTDNKENIDKLIRKLWIKYEDEFPYFYEQFDYIIENINLEENKVDVLLVLTNRLIDLCDHGWNNNGELDYCFEETFGLLNLEFKKINNKRKKEIMKEMDYRLQNYGYLLDLLE